MQTVVGLRFLRTLAQFGDDVPAYANGTAKSAGAKAVETKRRADVEAMRSRALPR